MENFEKAMERVRYHFTKANEYSILARQQCLKAMAVIYK
jgi:hypothetical protein